MLYFGDFTLWDASFLEPGCRIEFSHFRFMNETMMQCNNEAIVAKAIEINYNRHISQLLVSVTPDWDNQL